MKIKSISLSLIVSFMLLGCSGMPGLVQWHDDDQPDYSKGGSASSAPAQNRMPLDVPPELSVDVQVPMPANVAPIRQNVTIQATEKSIVAGQAVALDARLYDMDAADVFSTVIDAMTALNRPVESVDSPSGTITTDWIREGVDNLGGVYGSTPIRYRFVVRVLRQNIEGSEKTRLEIRTIGQIFANKHWVNKPVRRKVSEELFVAVEERLNVRATQAK